MAAQSRMWRAVVSFWRTLRHRDALEADVSTEVESYVQMLTDEGVDRGLDPVEARRQALVAVEGATQVRESVRESRAGAWVMHAWQDGWYGWRVLRRSPAFTVSAALTLTLAIGASAAMIRIVDAVVLAPLPFPAPSELVVIDGHGYLGEYLQLRDRSTTVRPASYLYTDALTLTGQGEPVRLDAVSVSVDFFDVLGVTPELGLAFQADDGRPGGPGAVMISHRAWQRQFGGDPTIVGRSIVLDGTSRTVRGVLPSVFALPASSVDVWSALQLDETDRITLWSTAGTNLGRLRSGHSLEDARAEIKAMAPTFRTLFPWRMPDDYGSQADVSPLHEHVVGERGLTLIVAMSAVVFVLVIACLNVGILVMGRSLAQGTEMATRAALGATRGRLARQVVVECLLLASLGGVGGLLVSAGALARAAQLLPASVPRLHEVTPDATLVVLVAVLSLLAGCVIGVMPVWRAARPSSSPVPGARYPGQDRRARRVTRGLVAVEIALAVVLVVGAGLLVRTLNALMDVDPGFTAHGLTVATVAPSSGRYEAPQTRLALFDDMVTRAGQQSTIESVAYAEQVPFDGIPYGSVFIIEGRPDPATQSGQWPWADVRSAVSPSFFDTVGMPIISGRAFRETDTSTAPRVAIVSAIVERRYWPDESAVGQRFRFPGMPAEEWITVVGVAADARWERLEEVQHSAMFLPAMQSVPAAVRMVARSGDGSASATQFRAALRSADPDTAVDRVVAMDTLLGQSAGAQRFLAVVFSAFGGVGLLLGALGIYGVTSDAVTRQRHEIAVRMAIGANPASVVRMVVHQGMRLSLTGVCVGLIVALFGSRALQGALYGVAPTDPLTFTFVTVALVVVAAVACYGPAHRAAQTSPLAALRE